ncbi:MAG: hypothetical protein A3B25_02900 [Candidatus Ryanbacteria bacterium RIFCSPLOWO2_01_FULL_48_26]|uniref:Solute-binding protein family 5 domain-containing protein n=1 Tax=Candidatus Ryanbacteria bacterium RIFCSPLOWO2_01_FULL_48_26 TaxID=1802126 RepID=A0A1G2GRM6_9BACT|nr:MAG: hypothetical protein A3B25_02900 [Candidatus Ryanbacteria bacterium RIFCSPLOWO2_01_FULL_48_26]
MPFRGGFLYRAMIWFRKIFQALTQKEKVLLVPVVLVAIFSGIVLLGLIFATSTTPVPASGGDYTEGFIGQPVYINPITASSDIDKSLVRLVFQNLGDITDTIATSSDGRIWKVRLKENLHWQDNAKLTSDDVIFTVQRIQDQESQSPLPLYKAWQGATAKRLSELEIQFSIINSYAFFPETLENLYILPKHIFAEVPPANWHLSDYNLKPIGSGPFKFEGYEKRLDGFITTYKLSPWDKYAGDTALIGNFSLMFFSHRSDLLDAFNSGKIDGFAGLEPGETVRIKRPHETINYTIPNYYAVFFNQNKNIPLKDLEVRKALSIVLDRDAIIRTALEDFGAKAFGPIPEGTPYFSKDNVSTSTENMSDLLDAAGWKIADSDFREKTVKNTKIPLELTLTVPDIEFLATTANLLKAAWEKIGVKVNLAIGSIDSIMNDTIKNRDYEALLFGNMLSKSYDLFSFWHSSQRFSPEQNLSFYNNKKADSLIESIRQGTDKERQESEFHELQKTITQDYPAVFLYSPYYVYVSAKNIHGADARLITERADRFIGANYWYTKTARVLK